jgi:hypothetical protein
MGHSRVQGVVLPRYCLLVLLLEACSHRSARITRDAQDSLTAVDSQNEVAPDASSASEASLATDTSSASGDSSTTDTFAAGDLGASCQGISCGENEHCAVVDGGPDCICQDGFARTGTACAKLKGCLAHPCPSSETCIEAADLAQCFAASCGPHATGALEGMSHRLTHVGNMIYSADGRGGLLIVETDDRGNLHIVNSVPLPGGYAYDVAVSSDRAYVAALMGGLFIIDVSTPTKAHILGAVKTQGNAYAVAVEDDYAYVLDGIWQSEMFGRVMSYGGFHVVKVSDPAAPLVQGSLDWTDRIGHGLVPMGDNVLVASGDLEVINVSDKSAPVVRSRTLTGGYTFGVAVSGTWAVVANYANGAQAVDISNLDAPVLHGQLDTPGYAYSVALRWPLAYVADSSDERVFYDAYTTGIRVVDFSDVDHPVMSNSFDTPGEAFDVEVTDDLIIVADGYRGIESLANTDGQPLGAVETPVYVSGLEVSGTTLFIAGGRLLIADILDAKKPKLLSTMVLPGSVVQTQVAGNYAYVAALSGGFHVVDVKDLAHPVLLASRTIDGGAQFIKASGNQTMVAASGTPGVLSIFDVSDPTNPVATGSLTFSGSIAALDVQGNFAYVATSAGGLQIVDMTDPAAPLLRGKLDLGVLDVKVAGHYAYLLADQMRIADVSDPDAPVIVGSVARNASKIAVQEGYVYGVTSVNSTLEIWDARDPTHPVPAGTATVSGWAENLAIWGGYVFVGNSFSANGVQIVDVSHPFADAVVARLSLTGEQLTGVWLAGNRAFVRAWKASATGNVAVVDVTNPLQPKLEGVLDQPRPNAMAVSSESLYLLFPDSLTTVSLDNPLTSPANAYSIGKNGGIMAATGSRVIVEVGDDSNGYSLLVLDMSNPATPVVTDTVPLENSVTDLVAQGSHVAVSVHDLDVQIYDLSASGQLQLQGSLAEEGFMALSEERLHLVDQDRYLLIDLTDPTSPMILGSVDLPAIGSYPTPFGSGVAIPRYSMGVLMIDISDPTSPVVASSSQEGFPRSSGVRMAVKDDYLLTSTRGDLLVVSPFACATKVP